MGVRVPPHYWAVATLLLVAAAPAHSCVDPPPMLHMHSMAMDPNMPPDETSREFLDGHNAFRARYHLPPVRWDAKVAEFAASYANERKADCKLEHSGNPIYGENIMMGTGITWTPADALRAWAYEEEKNYDMVANACIGGQCGHYTQIVWRSTAAIGCARVVCDNNVGVFMTCNYDPPGNHVGQRPY